MAAGIAYAQCMRSHGVSNFPDPKPAQNGQGVDWHMPTGLNVNSSQFQAATKACGPMPDLGSGKNTGGANGAPLTAVQQQQYLKWAACIRAHGVPNFPDPTFVDGHPQITMNGPGGAQVNDPGGAQMNAAQQACASDLRGIPGGGGGQ